MFIQKITINLKNIYTDHKVYLEETNQDKILLDIDPRINSTMSCRHSLRNYESKREKICQINT